MGLKIFEEGLIIDAVALIDFCKSDPTVLKLISTHLGQLYLATPVLEEVRQINEEACAALGIILVEPRFEQVVEAASMRGTLSFEDRVCLLLAKENGWTCLTNDKPLRKQCQAEGVKVLWGLETLVYLVKSSALAPLAAKEIAVKIHQTNRFLTGDILKQFLAKIGLRGF